MVDDVRQYPIERTQQYYRKYTDDEHWDVLPYRFLSEDFASGYHYARHLLWRRVAVAYTAIEYIWKERPEAYHAGTWDFKRGYDLGVNTYVAKWYRNQHNTWKAEQKALDITDSRHLLRIRLYEAKSCLKAQYKKHFINPIFDFENKRLYAASDSPYYLQWQLRELPQREAWYYNQQTTVGDVYLHKRKGTYIGGAE